MDCGIGSGELFPSVNARLNTASAQILWHFGEVIPMLPCHQQYLLLQTENSLLSFMNWLNQPANHTMRKELAVKKKPANREILYRTFTTYTRSPASYPPASPSPSPSSQQPGNPLLHFSSWYSRSAKAPSLRYSPQTRTPLDRPTLCHVRSYISALS